MATLCILFFLFLLILPILSTAQVQNWNITLGSSLSTLDQNRSWISPSGEFAFGFYPLLGSNLFLLAIWFDKIPEKTLVWTARAGNGNNPVQALPGSTIRLTEDGLLLDQLGQQIWSAMPSVRDVVSAAMLDTGNFVLSSQKSTDIRWQSFDHPTDTILPTQVFDMGSILSARLTQSNFSTGRFQLRMQDDGNLVLYTVALPTGNIYAPYWAIWNDQIGPGTELFFNRSGLLSFVLQTNGSGSSRSVQLAQNSPTGPNFYHRATLDFDGGFRKYVYPRSGGRGQSWSDVWSVPGNLCTAIEPGFGSGACGFNSYCRLDTSNKPICECPPGYSPLDPNSTFQGCKQDFVLQQECGATESKASNLFEMYEMQGIDWPGSDYERLDPMNEDECRRICLVDCFCAAAVSGEEGSCMKKRFPLSNGRMDSTISKKAFIKLAKANLSSPLQPPLPQNQRRKSNGLIVAISVLLGSSAFVNVICFAAVALILFPSHRRVPKPQSGSVNLQSNLHLFTYKEIVQSTNGFTEEVGRGAFGTVYKGSLPADSSTSVVVAVKRLDKVMQEGLKEFQTELRTISKIHHKNLVPLLGFCDEGPHRMLVYEFMSNGSLASFLFSNPVRPSWDIRMQLAFGIARGLVYLHEECSSQILHCDIKPENILLDKHLTARISDFGLAKLLKTDQSRTVTGIRGTRGYVAPEWFKRLAITTKVDVYSYGVVLLEIICCRKNVGMEIEDDERMVLTDWAYDCYGEGRLDLLVEDDEEAMSSVRAVERLVKVAFWCIQEDPSLRPPMKKVSQMLEGTVEVAVPPNPSAFISSLC